MTFQVSATTENAVFIGDEDFPIKQNNLILDSNDSGGDLRIQFGQAISEFLKWIDGVGFQLSNTLEILGNLKVGDLNFPVSDGAAGEFLSTDGAGNLFFKSVSVETETLPLPAVQVRRNSDLSLSSETWHDVDFNLTDIENDAVSLEHNNGTPDRIQIHKSGLFRI